MRIIDRFVKWCDCEIINEDGCQKSLRHIFADTFLLQCQITPQLIEVW